MSVNEVFIHHEGAGAPSDNTGRIAAAGYTAGIGVSKWQQFRVPTQDFSTYHHNHISAGICLTGNRDYYGITSWDYQALTVILHELVRVGQVSHTASVQPHRAVFQTDCPGIDTVAAWGPIHDSCIKGLNGPAPTPSAAWWTSAPTLSVGAHGNWVTWLQARLNAVANQHLTVDGQFGAATFQAVENLQRFLHLTVDGIVGPRTWSALR